jgi:MYXO-CTERM domain-containing protein
VCAQWRVIGFILLSIWANRADGVVSLQATSATVAMAGETADLCLVLDSGGVQVAGTMNDLVWDGSCATLASAAECRANPATGKLLFGDMERFSEFAYRGLLLSLSDVEPIPDGPLYCCAFSVEAAPGRCCAIRVVNSAASDPSGRAVPSVGHTGQLCVAAGGATHPPTPTPTPSAPRLTPAADGAEVRNSDTGGCQISSAPQAGASARPVGLVVLLGLFRFRRRAHR